MTNHPDADQWRALNVNGFMAHIGPIYKSTTKARPVQYALQTGPHHANSLGTVHGGVITSFLDQVIAIEAWNAVDRAPTVTVQMDARFLGSAKPGDFLQGSATIESQTRSLIFVVARIFCGDTAIASANAVMKVLRAG